VIPSGRSNQHPFEVNIGAFASEPIRGAAMHRFKNNEGFGG
jgi:hypothetical protein